MYVFVDIAVIFIASVLAIVVSHWLRLPSVVGLLVVGVLLGPEVLGLVDRSEEIEVLAEIGVVLLLFVIGLEFSLAGLRQLARPLLVGGGLQMAVTATVIGVLTVLLFGRTAEQSILIGLCVALSSTAVVLKILEDRRETEAPHGRVVVSTLIFQDLTVVPIMLAVPRLAGSGGGSDAAQVGLLVAEAVAILGVAYVAMRWVVPSLLYLVASTRSREAFLMAVLAMVVGIALVTAKTGLSLALGAFLAGLIISESEYSHQAVGLILPFRDVLMSLFFISVGLLLDLGFLISHPLEIALLTAGILAIKPIIAGVATLALGLPVRVAVLVGIALGQIGEFSFIVAGAGRSAGLLTTEMFQIVLATAVMSIVITPLLIQASPSIAEAVLRLPWPARLKAGQVVPQEEEEALDGHIVIVGFGVTGRNLAASAEYTGVPYVVIEINAETVRVERRDGLPILYGDATQTAVLQAAGIERARAVVVAIDDPLATRRIAERARSLAPDAYIVVRSRYVREAAELFSLGADDVVTDELEVSIEVLALVLGRCLVPRDDIGRCVDEVRESWRRMQRTPSEALRGGGVKIELPDLRTRTFRVQADSILAGRTIGESRIRELAGVTVLAIRRQDRVIANPKGSERVEAGDVLFVIAPLDWEPDDLEAQLRG